MKANVKSVLMKKYCRVYQAGAKLLMVALPWRSPKMLSGSGAVKKLPEAVRDRGFLNCNRTEDSCEGAS